MLTAKDILKEANNPDSPLHNYPGFEWDTTKAAYKYNKAAACMLRNSILYVPKNKNRFAVPIKVFIPIMSKSASINEKTINGSAGCVSIESMTKAMEKEKFVDFGNQIKSIIKSYSYLQGNKYHSVIEKINQIIDHDILQINS